MKTGTKRPQLTIKSNSRANEVFREIANQFYVRFQKEDVIDARRKADFIENGIPNAPPLTEEEQKMIKASMNAFEEMKGKRVAGTINDSVEKFFYRDGKDGAAWGTTVAKMDVSSVTLFTEVSDSEE